MPEPMIIADPRGLLPEGRRYWTSPDQRRPVYNTATVAQVFFGRSPSWLKQRLGRRDYVDTDEGDVTPPKGATGFYEWALHDIERVAHALAATRHIDGARLEMTIVMVRTNAKLHGLLS